MAVGQICPTAGKKTRGAGGEILTAPMRHRGKDVEHTVSMKENHLFRRLYAKGRSAVTPTLALYCRKNGLGINRLGLTVGSKVGNAVVRNRTRRRMRESYRLREDKVKTGYDLVLVARSRAAQAEFSELDRHLSSLLRRLELLV